MKELKRLDKYTDKYNISVQMWDEYNIYVMSKNLTDMTSTGGHPTLKEAIDCILETLDRWNKND